MGTGAMKHAFKDTVFQYMNNKPKLMKTTKKLQSCDAKTLNVQGKFRASIESPSKIIVQDIYVIKGLHHALLGGPANAALNLLTRNLSSVNAVHGDHNYDKWKQTHANLFKGLGKIKIRDSAKAKCPATCNILYFPVYKSTF